MEKGDIVVYESTVYPGLTEEYCAPILEEESGLIFNMDFFCGYSPERINPGDHSRKLADIMKITSGSTKESAMFIDALYKKIISAGTHLAPSIRVAEAAKVIENTQRDLNIALINELAVIFNKPIIFITTNRMKKTRPAIEILANNFYKNAVNISQNISIDHVKSFFLINHDIYDNFFYNYISCSKNPKFGLMSMEREFKGNSNG